MRKNMMSFFLWGILLHQSVSAEVAPDFAAIVKENSEAVVAVTIMQDRRLAAKPLIESEMLEQNDGLGSGFVISEDGYILTNYHVIQDANQIKVVFKDQHEAVATLVGADKTIDVALLKINVEHLAKVKIGSAASLEPGDWVMAIGSPYGFGQSVTKGIVSAKDRVIPEKSYVPFIQTDVPINKGNSGGPLFNSQGMVVGINAWIYSKTGGYQGLSFAIPIDLAMEVVTQLKTTGKVSRGWLGIKTQEVPLALAQSFSMPKAYGVLISEIASASPAQKAGLQVGDIIIAFNGQTIENDAALAFKVGRVAAGNQGSFEIIRQGEKKIVEIHFSPRPTAL